MGGIISAEDPHWIQPLSGLTQQQFAELVALLRGRAGGERRGRPWRLPLADRVLLVAAYWRSDLTLRQVAPLFGVSKSAAERVLAQLAPLLAISPGRRPRRDTVLIAAGDQHAAGPAAGVRVRIDTGSRLVAAAG